MIRAADARQPLAAAARRSHRHGACLALGLWLAACGSAPIRDDAPRRPAVDPWSVSEGQPQAEPRSRYGNPESYEVFGKRYHVLKTAEGYRERGIASWYGTKFHGRRTSSGEPYDMYALSAAHKTLPLPTWVRVRNLENGRSLVLRVNDRGPFHPGRIIDLSYSAAVQLGVYAKGSAKVEVEALPAGRPPPGEAPSSAELEALIAELQPAPPADEPATDRFLQLGAFRKMSLCQQWAEDLQRQGLTGLRTAPHENPAYRCRVLYGPFADRSAAELAAQELRALGHSPIVLEP